MPSDFSGVYAAVATPLDARNQVDAGLLAAHALNLVERGMHGVALFGTTGEGRSFSVRERCATLEDLLARGLAPEQVWVGTGACAIEDAVQLTRHALANGCRKTLLLPPFFYKGVSSAGVADAISAVLDEVGSADVRVALYHIPQVAGVGFDDDSITRLRQRYGEMIVGIKDSSGQLENSLHWIERHPGFNVFVGAEDTIHAARECGGAGSICGLANVIPEAVRALYDGAGVEAAQAVVTDLIRAIDGRAFVPVLKRWLAAHAGNESWARVRPPLAPDRGQALPQALAVSGDRRVERAA
jgi:4-hydroxy-tetrahydrodipicolinate synthase